MENMRRGMGPEEAIADCLARVARRRGGNIETDVSFIALRADVGPPRACRCGRRRPSSTALFPTRDEELVTPGVKQS